MKRVLLITWSILLWQWPAEAQEVLQRAVDSTQTQVESVDSLLHRTDSIAHPADSISGRPDSISVLRADSILGHPTDSVAMPTDSLALTALFNSREALREMPRYNPYRQVRSYAWMVDERFGDRTPVMFDTLDLNFQNKKLVEFNDVAVNYLGVMGSPAQSKTFANRQQEEVFLFKDVYSYYLRRPGNFRYLNTKSPFSMITYNRDLNGRMGEEYLNLLYSINVNRKMSFGFEYDLIYGRGYYNAQSTNHNQFTLFGSYIDDQYAAHVMYTTHSFKSFENGGISDDRYITDPEAMSGGKRPFEPRSIPTYMSDARTNLFGRTAFLTHHYDLGFYRLSKDSTTSEFVPVTSFIHTFNYSDDSRRYISATIPENYYANAYWNDAETNDFTKYSSIKNTLAVSLVEGFSRFSKFGLKGFVEQDFRTYQLQEDITPIKTTRMATTAGGELTKTKGDLLTFKIRSELGIGGEELGRFTIKGNIGTAFRLGKDTVRLVATGAVMNLTPLFYQQQYLSNHFIWNNSFKHEQRIRFGGLFMLPKRGTELKVEVENLSRHIYFNQAALPTQQDGSTQVITAQLNQNFKVGIFHLDNSIVFQKSSNETVIPVPMLSLYHNLYLQTKVFKNELALQIGADVRFHTKYKVPSYMPATGQFYNQDEMKVGGYPLINAYANFHLKNMRFYIMAYHVNYALSPLRYFILPHHPMNPFTLKIGLAWNFNT